MLLPALLSLSVPGAAPAPSFLWAAQVMRQVGDEAKALSLGDRIAAGHGGLKPGLSEQMARDDTGNDRQHNRDQLASSRQQSLSPATVSSVDRLCLAKDGWAAKAQPARRESQLGLFRAVTVERLLPGSEFGVPSVRIGSACLGRARDLTAGKLTPKLSYRKADIRGRQWTTPRRHSLP